MPRTNVFVCRSSRIVVEAVGTFFFCFQANQISTGGVKRRRKWSHSCSCDSTTDGHQYSRLCFSDTASAIGCQHTISSNQHIFIIKFGHSVNRKTGLCVSPKGMNWSLSPPNYVVSYDRRKSSFIHLSLFYIYLSVITLSPQSLCHISSSCSRARSPLNFSSSPFPISLSRCPHYWLLPQNLLSAK